MTSPNASSSKRLFLFAAYDKDCLIDDTLLYYLEALSKLGDIIFTMDNDTPAKEMAKLDRIPNILHASAQRHGEYDFGSYKRGYIWANDNQILDNYDWIYLTNDSVLGPMGDLESMLMNIESRGADCVGMVSNDPQLLPAHIQSWFVGLKRHVATSKFFRDFITNVAHQTDKLSVVYKYEVRMSQMLVENGCTYAALFHPTRLVPAVPCIIVFRGGCLGRNHKIIIFGQLAVFGDGVCPRQGNPARRFAIMHPQSLVCCIHCDFANGADKAFVFCCCAAA